MATLFKLQKMTEDETKTLNDIKIGFTEKICELLKTINNSNPNIKKQERKKFLDTHLNKFNNEIEDEFEKIFGYHPDCYNVTPADGARIVID